MVAKSYHLYQAVKMRRYISLININPSVSLAEEAETMEMGKK